MTEISVSSEELGCEFHHVQVFVDSVHDLQYYEKLSNQLNSLAHRGSFDPFSGGMRFLDSTQALDKRVAEGYEIWNDMCPKNGLEVRIPADFKSEGQDIVEQFIVGLGWRVTAEYDGAGTRSYLVASQDARGVKIVVTAKKQGASGTGDQYDHFAASNVDRFFAANNGRMGIAVLGFQVASDEVIDTIEKRYKSMHPNLYVGVHEYKDTRTIKQLDGTTTEIVMGSMKILEAYAYYEKDKVHGNVDTGTRIRYVSRSGTMGVKEGFGNPQGVLPGLDHVQAEFDGTSIPAYSDHWVSNVIDRNSFLDSLHDVVGFTRKVDFNAGVVAAGQAKIESTVAGNTAPLNPQASVEDILRDQSQVYLPTNNALTSVGHVYYFLKEMGQGVQHLAARVEHLVSFIERVNNYRKMTGRGFTFLNIPQSYYGRLDATRDLAPLMDSNHKTEHANEIISILEKAGICSGLGIVKLDITRDQVSSHLSKLGFLTQPSGLLEKTVNCIMRARYSNMYNLLRDHFSEETYLQIIRNQVLVDIQGNDVLFQIFTCNILRREAGDEAPFLEFIQRVCSEKKLPDGSPAPIKPGCGGFGIRNFLTLFLSIEVTKAMHEAEVAKSEAEAMAARKRVDLFTRQLDESNPILTGISDAMTSEGDALEELKHLRNSGSKDQSRMQLLEKIVEEQKQIKLDGNKALQNLSDHYSTLMAQVSA